MKRKDFWAVFIKALITVSAGISKMFNERVSLRGIAWYRTGPKQPCPQFLDLRQDSASRSFLNPTVMNIDYPHPASRPFNMPLAITLQKIGIIMAALDAGCGAGEPVRDRAYQVVEGVAIILCSLNTSCFATVFVCSN
ncbi:hypothetical protein [Paraburkholderia sp. RL18-085-BIA-A]|jgi:hypothetical protein